MIAVVVVEIHQVIRKNPKAALSLLDSFFIVELFLYESASSEYKITLSTIPIIQLMSPLT